jgi:hypothetical protein
MPIAQLYFNYAGPFNTNAGGGGGESNTALRGLSTGICRQVRFMPFVASAPMRHVKVGRPAPASEFCRT